MFLLLIEFSTNFQEPLVHRLS